MSVSSFTERTSFFIVKIGFQANIQLKLDIPLLLFNDTKFNFFLFFTQILVQTNSWLFHDIFSQFSKSMLDISHDMWALPAKQKINTLEFSRKCEKKTKSFRFGGILSWWVEWIKNNHYDEWYWICQGFFATVLSWSNNVKEQSHKATSLSLNQ